MSDKHNINIDKVFTIKEQYRLFLERIGLNERDLHPIQKNQLKQAFYGAWGQLLMQMRVEMKPLSEEKVIAILEAQTKEVGNFFIVQKGQAN